MGMIINPYAFGVAQSYLLDTYSGAAAAYSLRKLSSAYSGSAIRVRRSSDNTEQNIGFDGSGNLDTTALTSFVGAGNGFVTTWYDQSGNGKNATQSSAVNQPQIVTSGVVITQNSKPTIQSDGVNDSLMFNLGITNSPLSIFYCSKRTSGAGYVYDWAIGQRGFTEPYIPNAAFSSGFESGTQNFYMWSGNTLHTMGSSILNNFYLKTMLALTTTTKLSFYKNDVLQSVSSQPGDISTDGIGALFSDARTTYSQNLNGVMSEIIIYPSNQSSNRTGINSNINTFYSIY